MADEVKISAKHIAVVEAYLTNGFKREEAARAAGYKETRLRQTASDIFKRPEVKDYLARRMKEMQMSADEALLRLSGHAASDMRDFIGLSMDELKQHPNAWLIKELKYDVVVPKKDKKKPTSVADAEELHFTEPFVFVDSIKLYDAQSALLAILKQNQLSNGQPTERTDIPQLGELIELLKAAGKDPSTFFSRVSEKLKSETVKT